MYYRRLPLEGMTNARELGGWYTPAGMTRYGVFIRSEVPSRLTQRDMEFLRDYGVTMVVDLRGGEELGVMPDRLRDVAWAEYVHVPMYDADAARGAGLGKKSAEPGFTWGAQYVRMCEDFKDWTRRVMEALGRCQGAALYHCTTGKDRTGIITALLLGLCGVPEEDIVADYSVSQVYLSWIYNMMLENMPPDREHSLRDPFFSTAPENMRFLLDHWKLEYGGAAGYLRACGVEEELLERLRGRLLVPGDNR